MKSTFLYSLSFLMTTLGCSTSYEAITSSKNANKPTENLYFIGQDLQAIRGYFKSACCIQPNGTTAYLNLYNLIDGYVYGGLGYDSKGKILTPEGSWGAGPVGALQSATEFGVPDLAIGLSITENDHPGALDALIAGNYDAHIVHLGEFIKTHVSGIAYLRIGYEFDGVWNKGYENSAKYVAAWKRIVEKLRSEKVDNVAFVWQASAATVDDAIEGKHEDIAAWYPGDDYVDWMALSWFMNPDEKRTTQGYSPLTPGELSDEIVSFAREKGKPVLIAEASPQGYDLQNETTSYHSPVWDGPAGLNTAQISSESIWNEWFQPLFDYMNLNDDVIDGLAYINANWDVQPMWGSPYASGYWGDSRLEVNEYIAKRFNSAIREWQSGDLVSRSTKEVSQQ